MKAPLGWLRDYVELPEAMTGRDDDDITLTIERHGPHAGRVAVVVARDPARPPTLEDLRDHCSQVLPRWAAPRELLLVPSIARTSLGKVQRDALMRSASVER